MPIDVALLPERRQAGEANGPARLQPAGDQRFPPSAASWFQTVGARSRDLASPTSRLEDGKRSGEARGWAVEPQGVPGDVCVRTKHKNRCCGVYDASVLMIQLPKRGHKPR